VAVQAATSITGEQFPNSAGEFFPNSDGESDRIIHLSLAAPIEKAE